MSSSFLKNCEEVTIHSTSTSAAYHVYVHGTIGWERNLLDCLPVGERTHFVACTCAVKDFLIFSLIYEGFLQTPVRFLSVCWNCAAHKV